MIIDGKKIAEEIIQGLKIRSAPGKKLAAILVGDDPSSKSFLKQKEKVAKELGVEFQIKKYPDHISEEALVGEIKKLNEDGGVGGIIVQLPLPAHINRDRIVAALDSRKDVDALNRETRNFLDVPAVETIKDILSPLRISLSSQKIAVVGARGFLVGAPVSEWLEGKCRMLIKIEKDDDLSALKDADLIITGVGKAGLIKPEMLKEGVGVIDFGYDVKDGKISGDFDADSLVSKPSPLNPIFYTPVPGGTGPILVAELFKNFYLL